MKKKFGFGVEEVEITKKSEGIYAVREIGDCVKHFAGYYKAKSYEEAFLAYIREPFGQSETEMEKE